MKGSDIIAKTTPDMTVIIPKNTSILRRPIRSAMKPATVLKIVEQRSPPVKTRPICQRGSPIRLR
jgi:hypothetical protein